MSWIRGGPTGTQTSGSATGGTPSGGGGGGSGTVTYGPSAPLDLTGGQFKDSTGPITLPATQTMRWTGRALIQAPVAGGLAIRQADNTGDANLTVSTLTASGQALVTGTIIGFENIRAEYGEFYGKTLHITTNGVIDGNLTVTGTITNAGIGGGGSGGVQPNTDVTFTTVTTTGDTNVGGSLNVTNTAYFNNTIVCYDNIRAPYNQVYARTLEITTDALISGNLTVTGTITNARIGGGGGGIAPNSDATLNSLTTTQDITCGRYLNVDADAVFNSAVTVQTSLQVDSITVVGGQGSGFNGDVQVSGAFIVQSTIIGQSGTNGDRLNVSTGTDFDLDVTVGGTFTAGALSTISNSRIVIAPWAGSGDANSSAILCFSGTAASNTGLKSVGSNLQVRKCDDSALGPLVAASFYAAAGTGAAITSLGNVMLYPGKTLVWNASSQITEGGDGVLALTNNANTGFARLILGPSGSGTSYALKLGGTGLNIRNAADTADASLTASTVTASGNVTSAGVVNLANGTAALPSLAFTTGGAINPGVFINSSLGALCVAYNGAQAVGFTTSNPSTSVSTGTLLLGTNNSGKSGNTATGMRLVANYYDSQNIIGFRSYDDGAWANIYAGWMNGTTYVSAGAAANNCIGFYFSGGGSFQNAITYKTANSVWFGTNNKSGTATVNTSVNMFKPCLTQAANVNFTQNDSNATIEATNNVIYGLPVVGTNIGMVFTFFAKAAVTITINPNPADTILIFGVTKATGASVTCTAAIGTTITLHATSANTWSVIGFQGTWS